MSRNTREFRLGLHIQPAQPPLSLMSRTPLIESFCCFSSSRGFLIVVIAQRTFILNRTTNLCYWAALRKRRRPRKKKKRPTRWRWRWKRRAKPSNALVVAHLVGLMPPLAAWRLVDRGRSSSHCTSVTGAGSTFTELFPPTRGPSLHQPSLPISFPPPPWWFLI